MARGRHPTRIHIDPPNKETASQYLLNWNGRELHCDPHNFPALTSQELFSNNRALEIDFGCGTGVLACSRAQRYPDVNFLGIDHSQKPLYCAIREAVSFNIGNIKFIRGNFTLMLPLILPQTIATAFYLFPNPPTDLHLERTNLRRRNFLQSVYDALVPGGCFIFATDSDPFFDCMDNIIKNELHYKTLYHEVTDTDISTRYREIWEERGRGVRSFVMIKGA